MKKILCFILIVGMFGFAGAGCKAKYSFNTVEGKKKLHKYNSIQYGGAAGTKQGNKTKKRR